MQQGGDNYEFALENPKTKKKKKQVPYLKTITLSNIKPINNLRNLRYTGLRNMRVT
jgi:hypothetical protein